MLKFLLAEILIISVPAIAYADTICSNTEYYNGKECVPIDVGFYAYSCDSYLPVQYTELEYIANTPDAYIVLDHQLNQNSAIELKIQLEEIPKNSSIYLVGTQTNATYGRFALTISRHNMWHCMYDTAYSYTITEKPDTNIHTLKLDGFNHTYSVDSSIYPLWERIFSTPSQMGIFAVLRADGTPYVNNAAAGWVPYKLFRLKIWDNNNLVYDFIPATDNTTGVLGLYNTVAGTFHTSSGTGELVAGPTISSRCQEQIPCTKKPSNAVFTGPGINDDCPWECVNNYIKNAFNKCSLQCDISGYNQLITSTNVIAPLFAQRNTEPSIVIQSPEGLRCYADLLPGETSNAIIIKTESGTFHTVEPKM